MAPKKDKSKVEDEAVANLSTGWHKSKMSQSVVQELGIWAFFKVML